MQVKTVKIDDIKNHPKNARKGDINKIIESLDIHGQYKPLIVQQSTKYIIAGNHTYKALKKIGAKNVDIIEIDVDDLKAIEIMLTDNKTSDNANYDPIALLDLLQTNGIDISATGYNFDEYEKLKQSFLKPATISPVIKNEEFDELKKYADEETKNKNKKEMLKIQIDPDVLKSTIVKLASLEPDRLIKTEINGELMTIIQL